MRLVADESVDGQIVKRLRSEQHFLWYIAEMEPGIDDEIVLSLANHYRVPLLTADKDFGDLVFRLHRITTGVILLRLSGLSALEKAEIVTRVLEVHENELYGAFTVISPLATRIRKLELG